MNPSTSRMNTDFSQYVPTSGPGDKLFLYANPRTKKLEKYDACKLKPVTDFGSLKLPELIQQPWFQDNSLLFEKLLNDKSQLVICIYPPGSGKSTNANLLRHYLSTNGVPEVDTLFLNGCLFQQAEDKYAKENSSYKKFRCSSSFILFMDFNNIAGNIRIELEATYAHYMLECWSTCGLPDDLINTEKKLLLKDNSCVWSSLLRLRSRILQHFQGNVYVILDSLDNMFNLIANLPVAESQQLYDQFTRGVTKIVSKNETRIKTFIFGVSPYLITEFQMYTNSCYFIGSEDNSVGQFFSYSDESIARLINDWNLKITVDDCKIISKFEFNANVFINPYLCVSYLKSLKEDGALFCVNLSPRSLWLKCIFEVDDLNILFAVLAGESKNKFAMSVSMRTMCTISRNSTNRKLFYPLFIFGGYLSCKEETGDNDTYILFPSNESSKIVLRFHLDLLFAKKFQLPFSECLSLFNEYLNGNFILYCKNVSRCLKMMSSNLIKEENPYHSFMVGLIAPLILNGYTVEHDKEYGAIKPDSFIKKENRIILIEYKHVIPPSFIAKKARVAVGNLEGKERGETLVKYYAGLESVSKSTIVQLCRDVVSNARLCQLHRYASDFASHFNQNVEVSLMLFYINHVILLNCTYIFETKSFSEYHIFSSNGYFADEDLKSILNVM